MVTLPARAALRMPGQPMTEPGRKCSGSRKSSSMRRYITSTGWLPCVVYTKTWLPEQTRSRPSTSSTPHQPGKQCVLEVRRVGDARGKDDDYGFPCAWRGRGPQRTEPPRRVLIYRHDVLLSEQCRERPGHRQAVLHHVADAGRNADVVLQHPELALLVPD